MHDARKPLYDGPVLMTTRQRAARAAAVSRALHAAGFNITPIAQYEGTHVRSSGERTLVSCDITGTATRVAMLGRAVEALQAKGYTTTEVVDTDGIASFYATKEA